MNYKNIYSKKRITANEVYEINAVEQRQVRIKGFEIKSRNFKDEEYKYINLFVEWNGQERTLPLSLVNADEIARHCGNDPTNWAGTYLLLHAFKESNSDIKKLSVSVVLNLKKVNTLDHIRTQDLSIDYI